MFDNILLPIDLNHEESWEKALPAALQVRGDGGQLHLLEIVQDLGAAVIASYLPDGFEKQAMEEIKGKLHEFASQKLPDGCNVEIHVGHGHIAETILRTCDHIGADLIVMASHPPNDLRSMLIGSNAGKVVRNSPVPVLVVR